MIVRVIASALLACALVAATAFADNDKKDCDPGLLGGVASAVAETMSQFSLDPATLNQPTYAASGQVADLG
ncbi:MAG: hypothetical protein SGJ21_05775 [Alphaproteobacteria bacterium]|nr:hypothetical protein [Alphaproteobacteria bacterium]